MPSKLLQLLEYEGPEIAAAFEKASVQGHGTPQEIADYRENAFRSFVTRYFPFPHRIAKGNIIDVQGVESASIDCIIINPAHPYTIDTYEKFTVILADGVDVAIELKPDISIASELHRGLKQLESVKRLWRQETPIVRGGMPAHLVEHSKKIPCFLFSNRAKVDPMETAREVHEYYSANAVPTEHQVDFIVVNQVGIIANYRHPKKSFAIVDPATGTKITGLLFEEWKSLTIAAFLLYLNMVYPATPTITRPILPLYLSDIHCPHVREVAP